MHGRGFESTYLFLFSYLFIKKEMKHVWKGHGADSEIGNVSARQATMNCWISK